MMAASTFKCQSVILLNVADDLVTGLTAVSTSRQGLIPMFPQVRVWKLVLPMRRATSRLSNTGFSYNGTVSKLR